MIHRGPIGVDLGAHSIKAVQGRPGGAPDLCAHIPRENPGVPPDEGDLARLAGVLYRRGFSGNRVALAAPKPIVARLTMDLPPIDSGAPIDEIVRVEVARQRDAEPGSFEFRWDETPQPPRHASGARAIASSCTHAEANALLDLVEDAGLAPVTLVDPALCLARLARSPVAGRPSAVLDLGWSDATFTAVRGNDIRFVRSITSCGLSMLVGEEQWLAQALSETISEALRTPGDDRDPPEDFSALYKRYSAAIASEVGSSIRYLEACSGDEAPAEIVLTGGGAVVPGLVNALETETQRPVRRLAAPNPVLGTASVLAGIAGAGSATGADAEGAAA